MHESIADKGPQIAELCRRYGVRRLEVFGSAARGQDFDPSRSDVDFLVELGERRESASPFEAFFGLKWELEALLGRPVDLVSPSALVNPYVLRTIEQSREPVYGA